MHDLQWQEKVQQAKMAPQFSTSALNELQTPPETLVTGFKNGEPNLIFTGCLYWEDLYSSQNTSSSTRGVETF